MLLLVSLLAACVAQRAAHDGRFLPPPEFVAELGSDWEYTAGEPSRGWLTGDDTGTTWRTGKGGFYSGDAKRARGDRFMVPWEGEHLWLRKDFQVPDPSTKEQMVFWGRWDRAVTVYINGVLAVRHQSPTRGYRYLGLSKEARESLRIGERNYLAVVVERAEDGGFFDLALATSEAMTDLPQSGYVVTSELDDIPALVKSYMELHGIPAGVLAVRKGQQLVVSQGFGYMDKELTRPTPPDAVLRLASNDKTITRDAVHHLLNSRPTDPVTGDEVTLSTPVFPLLKHIGVALAREPADSRIDEITIWDLLEHRSGLPPLSGRNHLGLLAMSAKHRLTDLDLHDNISWLYRQRLRFEPGSQGEYSSTGYMLLRYVIHALTGDLETYLREALFQPRGLDDVYIAHERLDDRVRRAGHLREPWYATLGEPYARWIQLENYTALAASAPSFVFYDRHASGDLLSFGNMSGSWTAAAQISYGDLSFAVFFNIAGYYDELADSLRDRLLNRPVSDWGPVEVPFNYNPVLPAVQMGVTP